MMFFSAALIFDYFLCTINYSQERERALSERKNALYSENYTCNDGEKNPDGRKTEYSGYMQMIINFDCLIT